jgi:hypothetical protein
MTDELEGETRHVGPIIFANEYARSQLVEHSLTEAIDRA